jgi:hypothetical protein
LPRWHADEIVGNDPSAPRARAAPLERPPPETGARDRGLDAAQDETGFLKSPVVVRRQRPVQERNAGESSSACWWPTLIVVVIAGWSRRWPPGLGVPAGRRAEHVSPELAAELEADGMGDPDRVFTNSVADADRDRERRGSCSAHDQPVRRSAQSRVMSPSFQLRSK